MPGARWCRLAELTSVASLTETVLQQKLQENRRELKRRIESLRTFLWTILEVLENNQLVDPPSRISYGTNSVSDPAKEIDNVLTQIHLAEQMLEQLKGPQVRKLVQAIDEQHRLMETTTGRMKS